MNDSLFFTVIAACVIFGPVFLFKDSLLKLSVAIFAYPIFNMASIFCGGQPTRIVKEVGMSVYGPSIPLAFFSSLLAYISYLAIIFPLINKCHLYKGIPVSKGLRWIFILLFFSSLFISYPKAMGVGDSRFGVAGAITVVLLSMAICSKRAHSGWEFSDLVILAILLFLIASGERVDFVLAVIALITIATKSRRVSAKKFIFGCAIVFVLGVYSGLSRLGIEVGPEQFISALIGSVTNFGTAVDVVHVYFSGAWYYDRYGMVIEPLANVVSSYFPIFPWGGAGHEYNFSWFLRPYIDNVGGGLFYSVGMLALGPLGVLVFGAGYGAITRILFKFSKPYGSIVFVAFFVMQFRLQWYGLTYFGNVLIILLVVCYISALAYKKKGVVERRILMEPRGYK